MSALRAVRIAFDGINVWISGGDVVELRPSDGAILFETNTGDATTGIAFDGANVWVADFNKNGVHKF